MQVPRVGLFCFHNSAWWKCNVRVSCSDCAHVPRLAALPGGADVYLGSGAGGGSDQARHVPEVRAQEALVCQGDAT